MGIHASHPIAKSGRLGWGTLFYAPGSESQKTPQAKSAWVGHPDSSRPFKLGLMPRYCDVAVPVPLDATFTYSLGDELPEPCVGGRVIVPFRAKRLCGIVTEVHEQEPSFRAKPVQLVL